MNDHMSDADPAQQAFDSLREEVKAGFTGTNQAVASLHEDHKKLASAVPDYTPSMLQLTRRYEEIKKFLQKIHDGSNWKVMPEDQGRAAGAAAVSKLTPLVERLERQARDLETLQGRMQGTVEFAEAHRTRRDYLQRAAIIGALIISGSITTIFLPRYLPESWVAALAATVMGQNEWDAGTALLRNGNQDAFHRLVDNWNLSQDNADALTKCRDQARTSGKEQSCLLKITVPKQ